MTPPKGPAQPAGELAAQVRADAIRSCCGSADIARGRQEFPYFGNESSHASSAFDSSVRWSE